MTHRLVIYTKDIVRLTGYSLRKAQSLVQEIKIHLQKKKHQLLTIKEFAMYMDMDPDDIILGYL